MTNPIALLIVVSGILFPCPCIVMAAPQNDRPEKHSDRPKQYVVEPLDSNRRQKEAEIREFIWTHWRGHQPGSLRVTWYSKEGVASRTQYVFESDKQGIWSMEVKVARPDLKGTRAEHDEYRVYAIERIEPPRPENPTVVPVPEHSSLSGATYRLVLKDSQRKQIGRGSL